MTKDASEPPQGDEAGRDEVRYQLPKGSLSTSQSLRYVRRLLDLTWPELVWSNVSNDTLQRHGAIEETIDRLIKENDASS